MTTEQMEKNLSDNFQCGIHPSADMEKNILAMIDNASHGSTAVIQTKAQVLLWPRWLVWVASAAVLLLVLHYTLPWKREPEISAHMAQSMKELAGLRYVGVVGKNGVVEIPGKDKSLQVNVKVGDDLRGHKVIEITNEYVELKNASGERLILNLKGVLIPLRDLEVDDIERFRLALLEELQPDLSPEENAWPEVEAMLSGFQPDKNVWEEFIYKQPKGMEGSYYIYSDIIHDIIDGKREWNPDDAKDAEALSIIEKSCEEFISLAGEKNFRCVHDSLTYETLLPEVDQYHRVKFILVYYAEIQKQKKNYAKAVDVHLSQLRFSHNFEKAGFPHFSRTTVPDSLVNLVCSGNLNERELKRVLETCADVEPATSVIDASIKADAVAGLYLFKKILEGKYDMKELSNFAQVFGSGAEFGVGKDGTLAGGFRDYILGQREKYATRMNSYLKKCASTEWSERRLQMLKWLQKNKKPTDTNQCEMYERLFPHVDSHISRPLKKVCALRALRLLCDLEIHKLRKGRYPDSLDAILPNRSEKLRDPYFSLPFSMNIENGRCQVLANWCDLPENRRDDYQDLGKKFQQKFPDWEKEK